MSNIYRARERWKYGFIVFAVIISITSVFISNRFVRSLAAEERSKMAIWAEATKQLSLSNSTDNQSLILAVLQSNSTIPVVVLDDEMTVLWHANIDIPKEHSEEFLTKMAMQLKQKNNEIIIDLGDGTVQHLYYDESVILKQLGSYPYVFILVVALFIIVAYFILNSSMRAEQDRVWVGLSKETAHQLGTPISSLLAWIELLKENESVDNSLVIEMDKDVNRLQVIADRFSKIGSNPKLMPLSINNEIYMSVEYMRRRVSSKVIITCDFENNIPFAMLSTSLFAWVIENLCKNAIDAMDGQGVITIRTFSTAKELIVDVADTGKGMSKSMYKTIFNPGFTTKQRGWGLGLTLVKRIIEEYHQGRIFVKESEIGKGTTFRIVLPAVKQKENS